MRYTLSIIKIIKRQTRRKSQPESSKRKKKGHLILFIISAKKWKSKADRFPYTAI